MAEGLFLRCRNSRVDGWFRVDCEPLLGRVEVALGSAELIWRIDLPFVWQDGGES